MGVSLKDVAEIEDALRKDAILICESPNRYKSICEQVALVEYERLLLSYEEFTNLVIMDLKDAEEFQSPHQVQKIMPLAVSTVGSVVNQIRKEYPYTSPLEVFRELVEDIDWFFQCLHLFVRFDRRLMSDLYVRPLRSDEVIDGRQTGYYVEDGAHRAIAYAMLVSFDYVPYKPVGALCSRDWTHIYPWSQRADVESDNDEILF